MAPSVWLSGATGICSDLLQVRAALPTLAEVCDCLPSEADSGLAPVFGCLLSCPRAGGQTGLPGMKNSAVLGRELEATPSQGPQVSVLLDVDTRDWKSGEAASLQAFGGTCPVPPTQAHV